jgi:hypothetical protein
MDVLDRIVDELVRIRIIPLKKWLLCRGLMLANKKITVVLPAYNAAQTLKQTFEEIPHDRIGGI